MSRRPLRIPTLLAPVLAAFALSTPAAAAWLESGAPAPTPVSTPWWNPPPPPTPFPTTRWLPPPPPPPPHHPYDTGDAGARALRDALSGASLGQAYGHGGLTIVPVLASGRIPAHPAMRTLDDALRSGTLRIAELGSASVPSILVDNRGWQPVFLMAGEIIVGGKQDRVIREDAVIPARSGPTEVAVYCVEQGRWTPVAGRFESAPYAADADLRSRAASGAGQEAVWSHVARKSADAGVRSETQSYDDYARSPAVAREVDEYVRRCPRPSVWRGRVIGAVFLSGDDVLGVDLFPDASLMSAMWPKLVRSYASQAIQRGWSGRHDSGGASSVLESLRAAWPSYEGRVGSATRHGLGVPGFSSWGLTVDGRVVHIAALPDSSAGWVEPPPPWYPYE